MPHDEFRRMCEAVEGYTALGLLDEALNILEDLPPNLKITREVITLHMGILLKSKDYLKASYLAESLSLSDPDNKELMMEVAHLRYDAGDPREALDWLNQIDPKCVSLAPYHHLKAKCYAALGDQEKCRHSLTIAHAIDPELKLESLEDPAFESIFGKDPTI